MTRVYPFVYFGIAVALVASVNAGENISDLWLGSERGESTWTEVFSDNCDNKSDWKNKWFLDGKYAKVKNAEEYMTIDATAGFAVLWTKQSFTGDLKIEYDWNRAEESKNGVNIIYIEATGSGKKGYDKDISKWSDKREEARMSDYYNNMNTYHISYATNKSHYVRGRRYMPDRDQKKKLKGTELTGELENVTIFDKADVWIHVKVIKRGKGMYVEFTHPTEGVVSLHMKNEDKPAILEGRVGLRLMTTRISRFKNISISQAE